MAKKVFEKYIEGYRGQELNLPDYLSFSSDPPNQDARDIVEEYRVLTEETRLVPIPAQRNFSVIAKSVITRICLCRYTGQVFEVDVADYDAMKGNIPKGLYYVMRVEWQLSNPPGQNRFFINQARIERGLNNIPKALRPKVKEFWDKQLGNAGPSAFDPNTYTSPLAGTTTLSNDPNRDNEGNLIDSRLPSGYRPKENNIVLCGNCIFNNQGYCTKWEASIQTNYVCNAWRPKE